MIAGVLCGARLFVKVIGCTAGVTQRRKSDKKRSEGKHCLGNERPTQAKQESSQPERNVHGHHNAKKRRGQGELRVKEDEVLRAGAAAPEFDAKLSTF